MCSSRNSSADEAGCSRLQDWRSYHYARFRCLFAATSGFSYETFAQLISIGTERSTIELGRKSLAGRAAARPDLVRRVWDKARKRTAKDLARGNGSIGYSYALGYSCAGLVEECGLAATDFSPGDRVACVGQGFASHAEFVQYLLIWPARFLWELLKKEAAFGMVGIIALHGILRSAQLSFGSKVVVLGLGLLGLLTMQMLRAYGCEVIAFDPAPDKVELANDSGFSGQRYGQ